MRIIFLTFLFLLFQFISKAQFDTEFWFAAPDVTIGHGDRPIFLRITSASLASDVTISQPANPGFSPIHISMLPNTSFTVDLTIWIDNIENKPPDQVLNYGLNITTTELVTIYYETSSNNNPEIFALKGKNALGKEFYVPMQTYLDNMPNYFPLPYSSFDIVATLDNTTVTIVPTKDLVGHPAGIPFTVVLQKGQTYSAQSASQLGVHKPSGSYVTSNNNIAITVKDDTMNGLPFGFCADLGGDQIIPVRILGTKYIVVNGFLDAPYDQAFVVATQNNTLVTIDGVLVSTLNAGESYQHSLNGVSASYIETSAPVTVLQLSGFGCEIGISVLPSIECSGSSSVTFTRSTVNTLYITLMVKQGGVGDFLLNGIPGIIVATSFTDVPFTGGVWKYAQIYFDLSLMPTDVAQTISNTSSLFHLGMIHGTATFGCRFGHFSDYATYYFNIFNANTEFCEGDTLSLISNEILNATYFWTGPNGFTAHTKQISVDSLTTLSEGYYYVTGTMDGCVIQPDSIYIIVHPDYKLITDAEICDGDIFFWRNNDYSTAGNYTESIFSQYGCDSTYVLNLSIFPYTSDTVTLTECTPFIWPENGQAYTASGIYTNVTGCHTGYLDLTAIQSTSNISPLSACDTYTWPVDGQTYTTNGQYSYVQGCHTEYLDLTMNFSEYYLTDTIICDGEVYYWMGNNYSTAGTCFMYGLTADNCLITYEFQLTVSPSYEFSYNAAVCDYQLPFEWEGMQLTTSGVYTRTYVTTDTFACDSLLVMNFTVNPTYEFVTNAGFCQGDAYSWRGIDYFVPGIYFDSLLTQYGCDSVFVLNLNVIPSYEFVTNAEICLGDAFSWRGIHYFVSGIYFDSLLTVNGCDSVYVLNLIVHPTYELVTNAEVCLGEIYQWRGNYYSASGIYFDSLFTALSCDSVFVLNLTIHPEYEFVANAEICEGNIYTWRGDNYLLSGTFYDSLLTINGCDSVFILNLTIHPEYEFFTNVSICEGGIYSWRGSDYSVSGTYIDSFLTVNFCDSVFGLNLTVHPVYELVTSVDICEGDVYLWRGNMYSVSGVFLDSLLTAYSCDSVHVLNLTVHPAYEFTTNAEICEGQQYTWNDNFYDTSGTYTLNDITINGCDSIHILNLFVHQSYEFVTYAEICDNDIYTWKSNEYSNPGIYYDNLQTIYGCDSIYILNLAVHPVYEFVTITVLCEGSVFSWRGNDYSAIGTYIDSLTTVHSCDSVYILNLFVEPVYEFVTDAEICHGVVLFWRGMVYSTAGTFSTNYSTSNYCDSIYTLNLTVLPSPEAGFHASKNIVFEDDATIYFTDESVEAISWLWDFGTENAFDNSSLQNPVFTFSETREYIVWQYVENIQGCTDSVSSFIHVRPIVTLYVPNAFSPNGDGLNDEFSLIGRNVDPGFFRMRIYDRWGKLVFTSNDINITWNGKVMGSNIIAPVGVYIWIIEYSELYSNNNYFYNKTGTVTLIK